MKCIGASASGCLQISFKSRRGRRGSLTEKLKFRIGRNLRTEVEWMQERAQRHDEGCLWLALMLDVGQQRSPCLAFVVASEDAAIVGG